MSELELSDQYFDLSFLLEIADGATDFIVESIDMFLAQTPELMWAIYNGMKAQDRTAVAQSAHKLKPNLGFFGMLTAQAMMQEIEHMAKNGEEFSTIETKFNAVKAIVAPTLEKLKLIRTAKAAEL
jgi:HPt (histidine-containing phosphotransfer) domain-containing protein